MLRHTPLNAAHRRLGAKLVDFGGWEMPLHYGSQIEEHRRVRRDAGMFDVSHMLALDIGGPGAREFLRYALANDVGKLDRPGRALYSCLLNDAGGILDDLIVYLIGAENYRLVVNAATAGRDLAWLESLKARSRQAFAITPRHDLALLAVQGPNARARARQALPAIDAAAERLPRFCAVAAGGFFVARTGYTGEDGLELMFPAPQAEDTWGALLASGVAPCGLGARDTLRLEAGMNLYGQDMDEASSPAESGLAWTVDTRSAREFVGRGALERGMPRRRLVGLALLGGGVLRARQRVFTSRGEGQTTSGSFSPTLGRGIAFARVPLAVETGETAKVEIRERLLEAQVVPTPFVRNGRILVHVEKEPQ